MFHKSFTKNVHLRRFITLSCVVFLIISLGVQIIPTSHMFEVAANTSPATARYTVSTYAGLAGQSGNTSTSLLPLCPLTTTIAVGGWHRMALKSDGTVVAWGDNSYGQTNIPANFTNVVSIAAGGFHSLALKSDGTVVAWGGYLRGQFAVPVGLTNVIAIATFDDHNLALKSDGTVVAWGYNDYGQTNVPTNLTNVVAIAAGADHSLALKSDGTVVAWGGNSNGQSTVPEGLTNVVAIAAGAVHSLALKSDGTVVAWGSNNQDQSSVPAKFTDANQIATGTAPRVISIYGGNVHSFAILSDKTIEGWGHPDYLSPWLNKNNFVTIAAGFSIESIALKSDGSLVSFGTQKFGFPQGLLAKLPSQIFCSNATPTVSPTASPTVSPTASPNSGGNGGGGGGSGGGFFPLPSTSGTVKLTLNQVELTTLHTEAVNNAITEATLVSSAVTTEVNKISADKPIILRASLNQATDALTLKLDAALLQTLRARNATLEVNTLKHMMQVPLKQLNLDALIQRAGTSAALKDIVVQFKLNKSASSTTSVMTSQLAAKNANVVMSPVSYQVDYVLQGQSIPFELATPYRYVTKLIPTSLSASQVKTAVTLDRTGSISHSPTTRKVIDGQSYIVIQDMNLSGDYAVIQNSKSFADVATHWATSVVNEGGSRLIINGVTDSSFAPNRSVTRAEFASLLIRGLGLTTGSSSTSTPNSFTDVTSGEWYADSVQAAIMYSLITGYADKTFKPNQSITREEAMVILGRAMRLIGYDTQVASNTASIDTYSDAKKVSSWAVTDATLNLKAKTIQGDSNLYLRPQAPITRAETAAVILRLLEQASLINSKS